MQTLLRVSILTCCLLFTLVVLINFFWHKPIFKTAEGNLNYIKHSSRADENAGLKKIQSKALGLKDYAVKNGFNSDRCFMIDMSIPSGRQRFFIYSFETGKVENAGLVTHGAGSITGGDELYFSNVPGSSCTSLGKYKIGNAYQGRFGLAYKLHGLDKTNSKAFERFVVLHGHSCVPADEVYPLPICPSLGCPTVAPEFLKKLAGYIDASGKPVLLEIYK